MALGGRLAAPTVGGGRRDRRAVRRGGFGVVPVVDRDTPEGHATGHDGEGGHHGHDGALHGLQRTEGRLPGEGRHRPTAGTMPIPTPRGGAVAERISGRPSTAAAGSRSRAGGHEGQRLSMRWALVRQILSTTSWGRWPIRSWATARVLGQVESVWG